MVTSVYLEYVIISFYGVAWLVAKYVSASVVETSSLCFDRSPSFLKFAAVIWRGVAAGSGVAIPPYDGIWTSEPLPRHPIPVFGVTWSNIQRRFRRPLFGGAHSDSRSCLAGHFKSGQRSSVRHQRPACHQRQRQ